MLAHFVNHHQHRVDRANLLLKIPCLSEKAKPIKTFPPFPPVPQ